MFEKIISGGQTGVDQAALDAAIKLAIPHGGWVPKGRLTEGGPLPKKYHMQELPTSSYADRTERNVLDSDGTLIISHGTLTEGSEYTRQMAMKHKRPWLHIDLEKCVKFKASARIVAWLAENDIRVLNVAGPRASKDPNIYTDAFNIIESVYHLSLIKDDGSRYLTYAKEKTDQPYIPPKTLLEAVERLIEEMPLKSKTTIANMSPAELGTLNASLRRYISEKYGLLSGNAQLMKSCQFRLGRKIAHADDAVAVIINELWKKLRKTHKLRVAK